MSCTRNPPHRASRITRVQAIANAGGHRLAIATSGATGRYVGQVMLLLRLLLLRLLLRLLLLLCC